MIPVLAPRSIDNANRRPKAPLRQIASSSNAVTVADRAHDALQGAIVSLQLPPGGRLVRKDLSRHLGVSLTPLRDALMRLEAQGLVETRPQAETRVSLIDRQRLFELQFQRVSLETEVVRHLARRGDVETIRMAKLALQSQAALTDTAAPNNQRFHASLFRAVGMEQVFTDFMESCAPMHRCRNVVPEPPEHQRQTLDFHRQILARIAAKDAKGAVAAMRAHLSDDGAVIGQAQRHRPDWFR